MAYEIDQQDLTPVTDWIHDWDWLDPTWGPNAIDIWNDVREQCPMATTERYGRAFMPVTMEAVSQVAHDTEHFSSVWVGVARPDAPRTLAPPITSDPPDHHGHRLSYAQTQWLRLQRCRPYAHPRSSACE